MFKKINEINIIDSHVNKLEIDIQKTHDHINALAINIMHVHIEALKINDKVNKTINWDD